MTVQEILAELKSMSNDKVSAHNIKYGATSVNQFGVKMGDIRNVAKKLKADNNLALELWETKIAEAQSVAVLIMKPKELSVEQLDKLVNTIVFSHVADWFNAYTLKAHPFAEQLLEKWMKSDNKWAVRSAWSLLAVKIGKVAIGLDLDKLLDQIEKEMPVAIPEIQWTMNTALANIGIYHSKHRQRALDIGNRLEIYKDFPVSKGCTSPFAPIWINEMVSR
ncbi:MAG: DNA alkylation repair protein [Lentimicrobium sp.]|nr:DNA alkylation repair protein [Lentimicrobium sp.]